MLNPYRESTRHEDHHCERRDQATHLERITTQGIDRHSEWSSTLDEAFELVKRMARAPARDLSDLAIKLSATVWFLDKTDAVLDTAGMQQLRAITRDARRLAQGTTEAASQC